MTKFVVYPGIDENLNFPPAVRQELAESPEFTSAIKMAGTPQQRGRGAIVFTWDDNYPVWKDSIVPLANQLGQRHVFAIRTDQIGQTGRLTTADIAAFHAAGHEIASHTVNHQDTKTLSTADRVIELENSKSALEAIVGAGEVTSIVWPYGSFDDDLKSMAYGRYDRHVVVANQYIYRLSDHASTGKVGRFNWQAGTNEHLKSLIRLAATQPIRIVVMGHEAGAAGQPTLPETLEAMQLAYDLGVPCITLQEAFPSWYTIPNSGFEDGIAGWEVVTTGTGSANVVTDTPAAGLSGTKSLKLSTTDVTSKAEAMTVGIVQANTGVWAIQGRARVTTRTAGSGGAYMEVIQRDGAGSIVATTTTSAITSASWTKFSTTFTPDNKTVYVQVRARLENSNADAYYDHICLGTANDVSG